MTKSLEATNSDVAHLINEAKQSSFVMEYISNFQPEDIDSDDIDLRFEADGVDTGCDVSIVDQCGKAATLIDSLIAALEQAQHERDMFRFAHKEWSDKTDWVQKESTSGRFNFCVLGMHRVDVMTRHIAELESTPHHNGMMQLSNELAEMKRKCAGLEDACDRSYIDGMKTGWNYCDAGNGEGFNKCIEHRRALISAGGIVEGGE